MHSYWEDDQYSLAPQSLEPDQLAHSVTMFSCDDHVSLSDTLLIHGQTVEKLENWRMETNADTLTFRTFSPNPYFIQKRLTISTKRNNVSLSVGKGCS